MSDDSKFVLRWEIKNPTAIHAIGKAESEEFNRGGFKWTVTFEKRDYQYLKGDADFFLRCAVGHNGPWKCEANVMMFVLCKNGAKAMINFEKKLFSFNADTNFVYVDWINWSALTDSDFIINDAFIVEIDIHIINADRGEAIAYPDFFAVPNRKSNVILKIGEKHLHVSKEYLSVHSPVFDSLFFGDFAEKGKEEVEIKDVVCEEFHDLLNIIYFRDINITDRTVSHILKLADRFQMERLVKESEQYLIQSSGLDEAKKLLLADQYRLDSLKDHCLNSFTSIGLLVEKLKSPPDYDNFSGDMKIAICDKIMKLKLQ